MSIPTKQLQKLQIQGRMPTTRSQARREQREQTPDPSSTQGMEQEIGIEESGASGGKGSGPSVSSSTSPENQNIRGSSGIVYDSRQLSPASKSRAIEGMKADVDVGQCREINGYYAFELHERASVRVGPPEGPYATPTCSCTDFHDRGSACKHIYWLLDHLRLVQSYQNTSVPVLVGNGSVQYAPSAFEYIASCGLDRLSKRLGWPTQQRDPPSFAARRDQVQDMLSVFDSSGLLPEEYKPETFTNITGVPLSGEECYVASELERTLVNLAMNDDAVFKALREVVPPGLCALVYIAKLKHRAQSAIAKLDEYCTHGPPDNNRTPTDVAWCARSLRALVVQTSKCLNSRAPLPAEVSSRAAGFLTELLQLICTRNKDVYEDIDWVRETPEHESEANRNLYVYLIGNPPHSSGLSAPKQDHFVIDVLRGFPPATISQLTEKLEGIFEAISDHGAPEGYVQALDQLIERLEGATASSVSGQKRRRVG